MVNIRDLSKHLIKNTISHYSQVNPWFATKIDFSPLRFCYLTTALLKYCYLVVKLRHFDFRKSETDFYLLRQYIKLFHRIFCTFFLYLINLSKVIFLPLPLSILKPLLMSQLGYTWTQRPIFVQQEYTSEYLDVSGQNTLLHKFAILINVLIICIYYSPSWIFPGGSPKVYLKNGALFWWRCNLVSKGLLLRSVFNVLVSIMLALVLLSNLY